MQRVRRILLPSLTFLIAWAILSAGIHFLTQGNSLGTDFYIFYRAGQASIIDHADPYSDQQALQNQLAIFKRPAEPGEDQLGFAYPPYVLLAVWPLLWLNFSWAQAIWAAFLVLSTVGAIVLAFKGAPPWISISFLFFYPVTFGLILGNFSVLMGAIILLMFGLIDRESSPRQFTLVLSGVLLAWLTSKPQFVWLYVVLFILWALKKRYWALIASFGASLAVFITLSFAIVPGWLALWPASMARYAGYNQSWVILAVLFREILPLDAVTPVTLVFATIIITITGWLFYQWWRGRLESLYLLAWCGFAVFSLHPRGKSYEQIAFLVPMVVWAWRERKQHLPTVLGFWLASIILSWAVFFLSLQPGAPSSTADWPFLFYIVWLGWLFVRRRSSLPAVSSG
jgi:hypothetical protein